VNGSLTEAKAMAKLEQHKILPVANNGVNLRQAGHLSIYRPRRAFNRHFSLVIV